MPTRATAIVIPQWSELIIVILSQHSTRKEKNTCIVHFSFYLGSIYFFYCIFGITYQGQLYLVLIEGTLLITPEGEAYSSLVIVHYCPSQKYLYNVFKRILEAIMNKLDYHGFVAYIFDNIKK